MPRNNKIEARENKKNRSFIEAAASNSIPEASDISQKEQLENNKTDNATAKPNNEQHENNKANNPTLQSKKEPSISRNIRLTESISKAVDVYAALQRKKKSEIIEEALKEYIPDEYKTL